MATKTSDDKLGTLLVVGSLGAAVVMLLITMADSTGDRRRNTKLNPHRY